MGMPSIKWSELRHWLFGHKWKTTFHNAYMIEVEQKCVICGQYRHHNEIQPLEDYLKNKKWNDGRHPEAPENDGYLDMEL